jgi:hypothetical protein
MSTLLTVTKNFNNNRLPAVKNWTGTGLTVSDNRLIIATGGEASASLSLNGLNSSSYRLLRLVFDANLPTGSNMSNNTCLEFIIKYRYMKNTAADSDQEVSTYQYLYQSLVITPLNTTYEDNHYVCEKVVVCPELDAVSIECTIRNNTGSNVTLIAATLKQSYDTQASQLSEQIDWSMGIERIDAYTDGCLVTYRNDSEPLQIQWQENEQHEFNGVLVNGSLFIPFERHNEPL